MILNSPALRYHGGKWRLAPWLMQYFPPHTCYVEPFGGAASVLLRKPRSYAEVYNDLDGDIVNFFAVLRCPDSRKQLIDAIAFTPYARDEFNLAYEDTNSPIERARRTAIRASMGFGSAGATKGTSGFRSDTKRQYATVMHCWEKQPEILQVVGQRFSGVLIENRPAIDVIRQHDAPGTLFYVDPPYLHSTRSDSGNTFYKHEMSDEQHLELIATLKTVKGMVVLNGYPSELYDNELSGWVQYETSSRISAGRGTKVKTEKVWLNPSCSNKLNNQLFPI